MITISVVNSNLILQMNARTVGEHTAKRVAHRQALWIANTNKEVNKLNEEDFGRAQKNGDIHYRVAATHTAAINDMPPPTDSENQTLFQQYDKEVPAYYDYYIGQTVSVTSNIATQIGKRI